MAESPFSRPIDVRFWHCDPSGIMFWPNFAVWCHENVEHWMEQRLGRRLADLINEDRTGWPTAALDFQFQAPTFMGDLLTATVKVLKVGRASVELRHEFACGEQLRVAARHVMVQTSLETHKSTPILEKLRPFVEAEAKLTAAGQPESGST